MTPLFLPWFKKQGKDPPGRLFWSDVQLWKYCTNFIDFLSLNIPDFFSQFWSQKMAHSVPQKWRQKKWVGGTFSQAKNMPKKKWVGRGGVKLLSTAISDHLGYLFWGPKTPSEKVPPGVVFLKSKMATFGVGVEATFLKPNSSRVSSIILLRHYIYKALQFW